VPTFREICERVGGDVPGVLRRFEATTRQEPWIHLPEGYRSEHLGEVIALACQLALQRPQDEEVCRQLLHTAARHGESRLHQGLPDSLLFQELYLARESLWVYLREQYGRGSQLVAEAVLRVDTALSLASKAAIRGYHRPAFEARGQWPSTIDLLVGEWFPPPPLEELAAAEREESAGSG
jgi:hypothetical protein